MTDKEQIIINEVDVSECEFAPKEIGRCNNGNLSSYCKDNPNCYFKQLARKAQECEALKETNELLKSQMAFNLNEMETRLGNEVNRSETLLKELKRFDKIKDEFRKMSEQLKTKNDRYRKALEAIEKHIEVYECKEGEHFVLVSSKTLRGIINIINKVKGEDKND